MLAEDREEFDRQVATLCAAYSVPPGDRSDAFWRAFARISLPDFSRMVDAAIAPESEIERMPTVAQLWKLRKQARARPSIETPRGSQAALVEFVLRNYRLSDRQRAMPWNWITREASNPRAHDSGSMAGELMGLIVPQDPEEPAKFPARRVLFEEACDLAGRA